MIFGEAATGKSSIVRALWQAMQPHRKLEAGKRRPSALPRSPSEKDIVLHRIFPGAVSIQELIGAMSVDNVWEDGLFPGVCHRVGVWQGYGGGGRLHGCVPQCHVFGVPC